VTANSSKTVEDGLQQQVKNNKNVSRLRAGFYFILIKNISRKKALFERRQLDFDMVSSSSLIWRMEVKSYILDIYSLLIEIYEHVSYLSLRS
jgi:hypothetical protein